MSCIGMKNLLRSSFNFHITNKRYVSGLQAKIKNSYNFKPGNVMLSSSRIGDIINASADKCGDSLAIVSAFQNVSKTYSELRYEVERLASGLISIGLRKGDRLAICAPNCYEWPLTQFAAAKAGLILVNINPEFQSLELECCLKKVGCKALITWDNLPTQNFYNLLCDIIPDLPKSSLGKLRSSKLPMLESIVMISEENKDGTLKFTDLLRNGTKESDAVLSEIEKSVQFDDPASIQFTSGTTGAPKGAVLTHHNLVNNALLVGGTYDSNSKRPIVCCPIPLFHSPGYVLGILSTICYQGTIVLPSAIFDAFSSLEVIEKHKCSVIYGRTNMFVDIISKYKSRKFNTGSLKRAIVIASVPSAALWKDMKEVIGIPNISIGFGATETSPTVATNKSTENCEKTFEFMEPLEYVEMKIVDNKGHLVPVSKEGELCTRGHNTFLGYWDEEEKTREVVDKTHWYHTGDIATMNDEGFVKIVGRKKDMINRGGESIYPIEIENFLNTHPSVLEVHICSVPDERFGEETCAWICVKEGTQLTEEEIKEFCKGKISNYKIPRYIMFVKDFPKTATGKAKKFEMTKISIEKLKL